MIENFRRYTGLIFVVIVLLLLGFIFMDTSGFFRRSAGPGGTYVTVDGRGYSQSDVINLGSAPLNLATNLQSFDTNGFEIRKFTGMLVGNATSRENAEIQFFAGRTLIREARENFGVHPSDNAVDEFIKGLQMFQSPPAGGAPGTPGDFSNEMFNNFVQKQLPRFNLSERDFRELIRDVIASSELRRIIGSGLTGNRQLAEAFAVRNAQKVEVGIAELDTKAMRENLDPTEDELREYWEPLKEAFQTEKRIKVTYALISPAYPDDLPAEAAKAPENETDEEKEARLDAETKRVEGRKAVEKDLAAAVNQFADQVNESEGAEFDALLTEQGWTPVTTDWVTATTLPADLQLRTRGTSADRTISDELFSLTLGPDKLDPFPLPIAIADSRWLVARLDAVEEPREKTFEEAQDEVRERYLREKADEAVRKQVEEKTEAIEKAIEAGKTFTDAAKEAGLEPEELAPFGASDPVPGEPSARQIFANAAVADPGSFAETVYEEDRAVLVYVKDRTVVKDDNRGTQIDNFLSSLTTQNETAAFASWLAKRLEEAAVSTAQQ